VPALERQLAGIPGVQAVKIADDGAWLLRVDTPATAEAIATRVTAEGLGLLELRAADSAIEQTFLELTRGATVAA
jgi:ABC-type uncharacterized transport system ATPase subunit